MDIDAQLLLSSAQALTIDAASSNIIDGGAVRGFGAGKGLAVFVQVTVAADHTSGDETYAFDIQTATDAAFTSPLSIAKFVMDYSVLTLNSLHELPLPSSLEQVSRYLRLYFDGGGTTPTVTITAWVGLRGSMPNTRTYASGSPFVG